MALSIGRTTRKKVGDRLRDFARCRTGANAVEFALVAPILFFLLLGICYISVYLSIGHSLSQIAADASRHALSGLTRAERIELAGRWASESSNVYGFVNPSRLAVSAEETSNALRVTVAYDMTYLPVPPIVGAVVALPKVMRRSSTILVN